MGHVYYAFEAMFTTLNACCTKSSSKASSALALQRFASCCATSSAKARRRCNPSTRPR